MHMKEVNLVLNNNNTTRFLGITFIVLLLIFVIALVVMNIKPEQREKEKVNKALSNEQISMLVKRARDDLTKTKNLEVGSITDESMIIFASDYISVEDSNSLVYTEEYTIANVSDIEEKVLYIFDKQIDYSKVSFEIMDGQIYIPVFLRSTDAQVYKFRTREYNEQQDVYTAYIDCLEPSPDQYTELSEAAVTEYNPDKVINTMIFKYRVKEGRKILLAFGVQ